MIYFDNASTTQSLECVSEAMKEILLKNYGNPSSISKMGLSAEQEIRKTATTIANMIGAKEEEIFFTSGGTESNNWAIFGTARGYKRAGKHIITTKIEHPSISNPMKQLEEDGAEITYLSVDERGYISLAELEASIRADTILVSIMFVNNEVGTIQDLEAIGKCIKAKNPKTIFHVDGVQGFSKHAIQVSKMKIDLLSMSGHKIHASKGVGALYMKKNTKTQPLIFGGGQQQGQRGGTENTVAIAGLGVACEQTFAELKTNETHVKRLREKLMEGILQIERTKINGDKENGSPYILNVTFEGLRSEVLLNDLARKEIFVSAGSACNSKKQVKSVVLDAMGLKFSDIEGAIRFSFSAYNTEEEVLKCVEVLQEVVPFWRKYNR